MQKRYKMNLDVTDGTSIVTFVLLDTVVERFFQFPAVKIKSITDSSDIPTFMAKKVNNAKRTFHVKANTRDMGISYTIEKILGTDEVLGEHLPISERSLKHHPSSSKLADRTSKRVKYVEEIEQEYPSLTAGKIGDAEPATTSTNQQEEAGEQHSHG